MRNPIIEEIRRIRHEHARRFHFDLDAIFDDLKDQERKSGRKTVALPPRPPKPAHAGK